VVGEPTLRGVADADPFLRGASLLKDVEAVFDVWYNGSLARTALARLASGSDGAFAAFRALADFARGWFADHDLSFPRRPADAFACVAAFIESGADRLALECLRYDFLLRGKPGAFPPWFVRRYDKAAHDRAIRDILGPVPRRVAYARSELEAFAFDPRTARAVRRRCYFYTAMTGLV
jgi:hypothetical protein